MNDFSKDVVNNAKERAVRTSKRSWKSFSIWYIFALLWIFLGLVFPLLFLMGVIVFVILIFKIIKTRYIITNRAVYSKTVLSFGKSTKELKLKDISEIKISQNLISESMGYGDVIFKDLQDNRVVFRGINNPERWKNFVFNIKDKGPNVLKPIPPENR